MSMNKQAIVEAIIKIADEKPVVFEYSRHYGTTIEFRPETGDFIVWDGTLTYGTESFSAPAEFARNLQAAGVELRQLMDHVPNGNWKDLGGDEVLAWSLFATAQARQYLPR